MELQELVIAKLKDNPAQPDTRTESRALKGLKDSIQKNGQLSPILVTKDGTLIDGHRRVAVLKSLGNIKVKSVVLDEEVESLSSIDAFSVANGSTRKITALEYLDIYLSGGEIPKALMKVMMFISEKLGRKYLRVLKKNKVSPYTVIRVHPLFNKLKFKDITFREYFDWIVQHRMVRVLNAYEKLNSSTVRNEKLYKAIKTNTKFNF